MTVNIKGIGKITATKSVLILLAIHAFYAGEAYESRNMKALSQQAFEVLHAISDALRDNEHIDR